MLLLFVSVEEAQGWTPDAKRCLVREVSAQEPSPRHATGVATRGRHGGLVHGEIGSLGPRRERRGAGRMEGRGEVPEPRG